MIWIIMITIAVLIGIITGGAAYYQSGDDFARGVIFCGVFGAAIVFTVELVVALLFNFV